MSTYEALKYDFTGANITDISATPLAPTEGTWTPSFSEGSYANINGKYQKFGRLVFCQAEWECTTASADDNDVLTFGGLPFTAFNPTGGGYNNNWFVGQGYMYSGIGYDVVVSVKDNSTQWLPHGLSGGQGYRQTQYYLTANTGAMKSDKWRGLVTGTTDRDWAWMFLKYISAS